MLSARFLFSFFIDRKTKFFEFFQSLRSRFSLDWNVCVAVDIIKRHSRGLLLLLVDELIKSADTPKQVTNVAHSLGSILDTFPNEVAIVVSSLSLTPISMARTESGRPIHWIPMGPLNPEQLFPADCAAYQSLDVQWMISQCGGHARTLEVLHLTFARKGWLDPPPEDVLRPCFLGYLKQQSKIYVPEFETVRAALLARPVALTATLGTNCFEDLVKMGVLTNSFVESGQSYVPELPLVKVWLFLEEARSNRSLHDICSILDRLFALSTNFHWESLEGFHFYWERLVRLLLMSDGYDSQTLRELYPQAVCNPNSRPDQVSITIRKFGHAWPKMKHQFPGNALSAQSEIKPLIVRDDSTSQETKYDEVYPDTILVPAKGNHGFDVGYVYELCDAGVPRDSFGFVCVETRWSEPKSKSKTSLPVVEDKWELIERNFCAARFKDPKLSKLQLKEDRIWAVYIAFREMESPKLDLREIPERVLVLDLEASKRLYGKTLCQLRQFVVTNYKMVVEMSDQ